MYWFSEALSLLLLLVFLLIPSFYHMIFAMRCVVFILSSRSHITFYSLSLFFICSFFHTQRVNYVEHCCLADSLAGMNRALHTLSPASACVLCMCELFALFGQLQQQIQYSMHSLQRNVNKIMGAHKCIASIINFICDAMRCAYTAYHVGL